MKNKSQSRLTLALAIVYGLLVVWIILFKMSPIPEIPYLDHIRHINLIPFHYDTEVDSHAQEVIENLLIFIPLGLYLKMLRAGNRMAILICAGFSLLLECLQYVIGIGATDITDLITNTAGAAIGVGVYCLLSRLFKDNAKLNKVLNVILLVCTVFFIGGAVLLLLSN